MKYLLRLRLNASGSRTFITTVHIAGDVQEKKGQTVLWYWQIFFFLITLLGTGGSPIPTYEKLGIGGSLILTFRCFLTHLCITHRVPTSINQCGEKSGERAITYPSVLCIRKIQNHQFRVYTYGRTYLPTQRTRRKRAEKKKKNPGTY